MLSSQRRFTCIIPMHALSRPGACQKMLLPEAILQTTKKPPCGSFLFVTH